MPIHTQDYRHWEGTLTPRSYTRWWVITKAELKLLAQRKIVRLIVAIPPLIYILVHATLIYIINQVPSVDFQFEIDGDFFQKFLFRVYPFSATFLVALVAIFGGAGLIATDLKNNALSLYLSKPISWIDYLIGKFATIGILLGCLTLVPGLLLFLEQSLLAGTAFLKAYYWVPFSLLAYSVVIILSTSLLILLFSSLTTNSRYAIIGFSVVWFGSSVTYEVLKTIARTSKVALVSICANYDILGTTIFGGSPNYSVHWVWSLLIQIIVITACLFVLHHRIRAVEIVK